MAQSTDEVALIILAALTAEQNRQPGDMRLRRPLGVLTKDLMVHHHWAELDFLQGWGLIMSEKLAEVQQHDGAFYPCITDAGREYMEEQRARFDRAFNRAPLFTGKQLFFIIAMVVMALRLGYIFWKIDH